VPSLYDLLKVEEECCGNGFLEKAIAFIVIKAHKNTFAGYNRLAISTALLT
jgi:hypothetical protein